MNANQHEATDNRLENRCCFSIFVSLHILCCTVVFFNQCDDEYDGKQIALNCLIVLKNTEQNKKSAGNSITRN